MKHRHEQLHAWEMRQLASGRAVVVTAIALGICFSMAYFRFSPSIGAQQLDSLMYSYGAETKGIGSIWGNHPLGHVVQNGFFLAARYFGYAGRALPLFQVLNNLIGGLIVSVCFLSCVMIFRNTRVSSLLMAVLLGGSASLWTVVANTGDIYSYAFLFSLLAWSSLLHSLYARKGGLLVLPGIAIGLAILAHQLNVFLLPAALALIWTAQGDRLRRALSLLGSTAMTVSLGYGLIWYLTTPAAISPASTGGIGAWAWGYLAMVDPPAGQSLDWESLRAGLRGVTGALVFGGWSSLRFKMARAILLFPFGLATLIAIARLHRLSCWRRGVVFAALLQWASSTMLILWWEPANPKYYTVALVPFFVFMAATVPAVEQSIRRFRSLVPKPLQLVSVALLLLSPTMLSPFHIYTVANQSHSILNEAEVWSQHSGRDDLLIPLLETVAPLKFWADRPNIARVSPAWGAPGESSAAFVDLDRRINVALCGGHSVLFSPQIIDVFSDRLYGEFGTSKQEYRVFFGRYDSNERFSYRRGTLTVHVYSFVRRAADCYEGE